MKDKSTDDYTNEKVSENPPPLTIFRPQAARPSVGSSLFTNYRIPRNPSTASFISQETAPSIQSGRSSAYGQLVDTGDEESLSSSSTLRALAEGVDTVNFRSLHDMAPDGSERPGRPVHHSDSNTSLVSALSTDSHGLPRSHPTVFSSAFSTHSPGSNTLQRKRYRIDPPSDSTALQQVKESVPNIINKSSSDDSSSDEAPIKRMKMTSENNKKRKPHQDQKDTLGGSRKKKRTSKRSSLPMKKSRKRKPQRGKRKSTEKGKRSHKKNKKSKKKGKPGRKNKT